MHDPEIELLLSNLREDIQSALGKRLVGLYLYGSLATGGYEPGISDADLLAVINGELTDDEFDRLETMHAEFERRFPEWDDRIEVAYLSIDALGSFKERRSRIVVISPGDPLHITDAGSDWLMNWHLVRNGGQTLFGPNPAEFIAPTTETEFVDSLCAHVFDSDDWFARARTCKAQSYVVLTMCRTLAALDTSEHASKRQASTWVQSRYPEWAELAARALIWRHDPLAAGREDSASFAEMLRLRAFVEERARARVS